MIKEPILPLLARTTSGTSYSLCCSDHLEAQIFLNITAVSGTTPTLDITVEYSPDNSEWYSHTSFSQKTATGKDSLRLTGIGGYLRVKYTIAGTTPSFTFSVDIVLKSKD
ncbi:MAG: hypothetical protein ACOYWZ_20035 [Bacillota bacterium]